MSRIRPSILYAGLFAVLCGALALCAQQAPLPPGTTAVDAGGQAAVQPSDISRAEEAIEARDYSAARSLLEDYLARHAPEPHPSGPGSPDPQSTSLQAMGGRALFDLGFVEDAQEHSGAALANYRKAIDADPAQFEARLALGLLLARSGQTDEAERQLQAAIGLEPAPPNPAAKAQAFRTLAQLERSTDPVAAKAALLEALKLGPEAPGDGLLTAEIAEASDDDETAEAAYRRVLKAQPSSSAAVAGLVHLLLKEKKYSDAEPLLRSALDRDPDDPALNSQLASSLAAEGKQTEAVAVLEKLYQLEPHDRLIGSMLADAYTQSGDPAKADPIYEELLKDSPQDADLLISRGDNLIRQHRPAEAQAVLEAAVKLKSADPDAWSSLAFASSENHAYTVSLQSLSMRSKYAADTPGTYFLWATAYDNLHQTKLAAGFYEKFLQAAGGKFPDQEWQAKHRLIALQKMR